MTKFEKVCKKLEEKTINTNDYITLTKNVDCRHNGLYAPINVITTKRKSISFKTLKEVEEYYNL